MLGSSVLGMGPLPVGIHHNVFFLSFLPSFFPPTVEFTLGVFARGGLV